MSWPPATWLSSASRRGWPRRPVLSSGANLLRRFPSLFARERRVMDNLFLEVIQRAGQRPYVCGSSGMLVESDWNYFYWDNFGVMAADYGRHFERIQALAAALDTELAMCLLVARLELIHAREGKIPAKLGTFPTLGIANVSWPLRAFPRRAPAADYDPAGRVRPALDRDAPRLGSFHAVPVQSAEVDVL